LSFRDLGVEPPAEEFHIVRLDKAVRDHETDIVSAVRIACTGIPQPGDEPNLLRLLGRAMSS
jgi:hypothetical protein